MRVPAAAACTAAPPGLPGAARPLPVPDLPARTWFWRDGLSLGAGPRGLSDRFVRRSAHGPAVLAAGLQPAVLDQVLPCVRCAPCRGDPRRLRRQPLCHSVVRRNQAPF